jgi:hypothetical protein
MTTTKGLAVVTYLGLRQPKKSCEPVTSGPPYFKDCIEALKKCHPCKVFTWKMRSHPTPLHPIIIVGPFTKWGVDFIDCNPSSTGGHQHIIEAVDYFTKWDEAMPTIKSDGNTATFCSTKLLPSSVSRVRLSLIMTITFRMK